MNWSIILTVITLAAVALTVFVGIMGLRQGHYYRGKITKRGKHAIAAMIALGLVTAVSFFAGQQISEAKEKDEADTRSRQFNDQMTSLRKMTADLRGLQQNLGASIQQQQLQTERLTRVQETLGLSLDRQERLATASKENLRQGRILQAQGRAQTASLVRQVRDSTDRVSPANFEIYFDHLCVPSDSGATLQLTSESAVLILEGPAGRGHVRSVTSRRTALQTAHMFTSFTGRLDSYEIFPSWRNVRASLRITAFREGSSPERISRDDFSTEGPPATIGNRPARTCTSEFAVQVKERVLFMGSGLLREIREDVFVLDQRDLVLDEVDLPDPLR